MEYPSGWELRKQPTEQYPDLHVLHHRDRGPVAAINFAETIHFADGTCKGSWEFWPMKGAGATGATGFGYQTLDTAAKFAMKRFWVEVVEQPDLSDLDDEDYDYARR